MKVGTITGFSGSWGSGMATLWINGKPVHCDNAPTVRALDAMFPGTISEGHTVSVNNIIGQTIRWDYDEMGLFLGAIAPFDEE